MANKAGPKEADWVGVQITDLGHSPRPQAFFQVAWVGLGAIPCNHLRLESSNPDRHC